MNVTVEEKEISMAVLNGLRLQYSNLIGALDAMENGDKLFTLYYVLCKDPFTTEKTAFRNAR